MVCIPYRSFYCVYLLTNVSEDWDNCDVIRQVQLPPAERSGLTSRVIEVMVIMRHVCTMTANECLRVPDEDVYAYSCDSCDYIIEE